MRPLHALASLSSLSALTITAVVLAATPALPSPGDPVDPEREGRNFAKTQERASEYLTPETVAESTEEGLASFAGGLVEQASDPGRLFVADLCWSKAQGCGGDPRLDEWDENGYGLSRPVQFVARNGSTLAGHVWATRRGPERRPLVVITNGSVQASEELYWWAAQTLAKSGYVVLTWEPQGQGRSDTFGTGEDTMDGVPSQSTGHTFYDHTQDALDFALSTRDDPYCPRTSRSGTSHCGKQRERVKVGAATAHNPFRTLVDPRRVGLAGHSYGASGVSWVGQKDRRVDAVVAWDHLCDPAADTGTPGAGSTGCLPGARGRVEPRVPSLGMSADYGLTPSVFVTRPEPKAKLRASRAFTRAGVDTGELVIRGGTHYEFSYIPTPTFGATLRGMDLAAWYTTAWMDRYVKGDRSGLRRLLTDRWRHDGTGAAVDAGGDGNLFSFYHRSRLDLGHDGGQRVRCGNLRRGCADLVEQDGQPESYSYLAIATSKDR